MDFSSWPVMQYKVSPTNNIWNPMEGSPIQLWKTNLDGFPKLPIGVHNLVPYHPSRGHDAMRSVGKETFINA